MPLKKNTGQCSQQPAALGWAARRRGRGPAANPGEGVEGGVEGGRGGVKYVLALSTKSGKRVSTSFQDVDFCLRARRRGLQCLLSPHIKLFHYESSSRNPQVDDETLSALRSFHADMMTQKDEFALWAYQPVRVPLLSLSRIVHTRNQIHNNLQSLLGAISNGMSSQQRLRFELLIK